MPFRIDLQLELGGNSQGIWNLDQGAVVGEVPYRTVGCAVTAIEYDMGALQGSGATDFSMLFCVTHSVTEADALPNMNHLLNNFCFVNTTYVNSQIAGDDGRTTRY
jgi:hypothetical protein